MSRDDVIAAIYETVVRPAYFGRFMEAWRDHVDKALADPVERDLALEASGTAIVDPELGAHFRRAYEILERMGRRQAESGLADRIARTNGFAVLATADGRVLAAGKAAVRVLGRASRLDALDAMLAANSRHLLHDLMRTLREGRDPGAPVVLTTDTQPRHLIARAEPGPEPRLVIEALDFRWDDRAEGILVDSFGLSPAEVDIVRNLMAGFGLREIAQRSGRSEHTVRNQAKAVLSKTGAPGQVDLIRLVAYLVKADARTRDPNVAFPDLDQEVVRMSSGLDMELFHAGSRSGHPVIFLHGMQDAMAPLQFLNARLARRGYRVIAPVRPGYGRSAPVADPETALNRFIDHVAEIVGALAPRKPLILGHMAGTIYGHVLTGRLHGRIAGMLSVSGAAPILRVADLAAIAPRHRAVAYTARYAPALLPFVLRAGIAQIDGKDFAAFLDGIFPPGGRDHEVIRRLDLAPLIRSGYRFSVQQGHLGFMADALLAVRDWRTRIRQPAAPVVMLHGGNDPVVRPASVRGFAAGQGNVALRFVPDGGQLIVYEHPETVLEELDRMAGRGDGTSRLPEAG